jgi:RecB family endonuclease NucS
VPIFELTKNSLVPVATTTFAAEHIRERYDLQRVLRDNIGAIAPETLVLAEEYGEWKDSRRRIDLLCLDKDASLVVVELKRTEDGGHMELQAIRYAAMVSKMTFAQAVEAHSRYLGSIEKEEEAKAAILTFLGGTNPRKSLRRR